MKNGWNTPNLGLNLQMKHFRLPDGETVNQLFEPVKDMIETIEAEIRNF
jgi:hypothetical protein